MAGNFKGFLNIFGEAVGKVEIRKRNCWNNVNPIYNLLHFDENFVKAVTELKGTLTKILRNFARIDASKN